MLNLSSKNIGKIARVLMGIIVFLSISIKVGLYNGLPAGTLNWLMLILGMGFALLSLTEKRIVSTSFGIYSMLFGAYLALTTTHYPMGLLLVLGGILVLIK